MPILTRAIVLTAILLFTVSACESDYTPRPKGYFRITPPEQEYSLAKTPCPYIFEKNDAAKFRLRENCWGDIVYPSLKATVQLTYKPVQPGTLDTLLGEGHRMAYEHTVKADGIKEELIYDTTRHVYGLYYRIKGDVATNAQFFVTDSSNHFLRGALYFYASPNADSLRPAIDYMEEEIGQLLGTLKWQN